MINLLPQDYKRQIVASRTNSLILRYIFLMTVVVAIMVLEMFAVYLILNSESLQNQATIQESQAKAGSYAATQAEAATFRANLSTAKYILDKQIPYTSLIIAVAQALPSGASLDNLTLSPSTFGAPTTLTVKAASARVAIETKETLRSATLGDVQIFNDVSFKSLAQVNDTTGNYYTAIFDITYSKGLVAQ